MPDKYSENPLIAPPVEMLGEDVRFYSVAAKPDPQRGYPELWWHGRRPFAGVHYYPAQHKETHGEPVDGWRNKLYWGDNLQVMGHLLRKYRGQVKLIYIDPPFDSKADYKKKIEMRGETIENDRTGFEEKQYGDIWTNDEYLQFMYERLILMRELLAFDGSIYLQCDWHRGHQLRNLMDEVFGPARFQNEIVWNYSGWNKRNQSYYNRRHDAIYYYSVGPCPYFEPYRRPWASKEAYVSARKQKVLIDESGREYVMSDAGGGERIRRFLDEAIAEGAHIDDVWAIDKLNNSDKEHVEYPTQKPERLIERIISSSCPPGGLVFDCFMGSGTTQAVAMKLGRKFIGADINLGAVQTTTDRLLGIAKELKATKPTLFDDTQKAVPLYTSFEVHTVNQYDLFRSEVDARALLMEALAISPTPGSGVWHGTLGEEPDARLVHFMPINRIATKADLDEIFRNLGGTLAEMAENFKKRPNKPAIRITLVCMGHEPDLGGHLAIQLRLRFGNPSAKLDIEVCDILRDKADIEFKRKTCAEIEIKNGTLSIEKFYPGNLLQKFSKDKREVGDWRELAESVFIDWNYDGTVLAPAVTDIPEGKALVKGTYPVPRGAKNIRVKITDLLSDSFEVTLQNPDVENSHGR